MKFLLLLAFTFSIANAQNTKTILEDCLKIQDGVCVNKDELGSLSGVTENINVELSDIKERTSTTETSVADHETRITDNEENIQLNETRLSEAENEIVELKSEVSSLETGLTTLDSQVVHKSGDETINGTKYFAGRIVAQSTSIGSNPCPTMTDAQMLAISTPTSGQCVNNTTKDNFYRYSAPRSKWVVMGGGAGGGGSRLELQTDPSFEDGLGDGVASGSMVRTQISSSGEISTPSNEYALSLTVVGGNPGAYTVTKTTGPSFAGLNISFDILVKSEFDYGCSIRPMRDGSELAEHIKPIVVSSVWKNYPVIFPAGTTSVGYRISCLANPVGSGGILIDESRLRVDSTSSVITNLSEVTQYSIYSETLNSNSVDFNTPGNFIEQKGSGAYTLAGNTLTARQKIRISTNLFGRCVAPGTGNVQCGVSSIVTKSGNSFNIIDRGFITGTSGGFSEGVSSTDLELDVGDTIVFGIATTGSPTIGFKTLIIRASASNPNLISSNDTFSTDYIPLYFKSTACLSSEVGCYNTWSYPASSTTKTICTTRPTQTDADMMANGFLITKRAYASASTCALPARFDVVIGQRKKGPSIDGYASTGKTSGLSLDFVIYSGDSSTYGAWINGYDETSGVYSIDVGLVITGTTTSLFRLFTGGTQGNAYIVLNGSKTTSQTATDLTTFGAFYYTTTPLSIGTSATTLNFSTPKKLIGVTYNSSTGEFTSQNNGTCDLKCGFNTAALTLTTSQRIYGNVYVNSTVVADDRRVGSGGSSISYGINPSVPGYPIKTGDVITCRSGSDVAATASANGEAAHISIDCRKY